MGNLERRVAEIEKEMGEDTRPKFMLGPETTIEEAHQAYQERIGEEVSMEEFKRRLPTMNFGLLSIVDGDVVKHCQWIEPYLSEIPAEWKEGWDPLTEARELERGSLR